jgi:ankyrin repeat protein
MDRGADIEAKDKYGDRFLHLAARKNSFETARLLIDRGANVDATDKRGRTPLHLADRYHHLEVACRLIDRGANTENIDLRWMNCDISKRPSSLNGRTVSRATHHRRSDKHW